MNFFSSAAALLLLLLSTLSAVEDVSYEVSEVQVKLAAKPRNESSLSSSSNLSIEQIARDAVAQATIAPAAKNCCHYPVGTPRGFTIPAYANFECSEPMNFTCQTGYMYEKVGIARYEKGPLADVEQELIAVAPYVMSVILQCNTTSLKWTMPIYSKELEKVACAYMRNDTWIY